MVCVFSEIECVSVQWCYCRLRDFNEWGQCQILEILRRYEPSSEEDLFDILVSFNNSVCVYIYTCVLEQLLCVYWMKLIIPLSVECYMKLSVSLCFIFLSECAGWPTEACQQWSSVRHHFSISTLHTGPTGPSSGCLQPSSQWAFTYHTYTHRHTYHKPSTAPLLTLIGSGSSELAYTCLQHVQLLLARQSDLWTKDYHNFYCRYTLRIYNSLTLLVIWACRFIQ